MKALKMKGISYIKPSSLTRYNTEGIRKEVYMQRKLIFYFSNVKTNLEQMLPKPIKVISLQKLRLVLKTVVLNFFQLLYLFSLANTPSTLCHILSLGIRYSATLKQLIQHKTNICGYTVTVYKPRAFTSLDITCLISLVMHPVQIMSVTYKYFNFLTSDYRIKQNNLFGYNFYVNFVLL